MTTKEIETCIDIWERSEKLKSPEKIVDRSKVPDSIFRIQGRKPLLVLHFLSVKRIKSDNKSLDQSQISETAVPTAWSISFPKTNLATENVEYQVNSTWMKALEEIDRIESEGIEDGDL